MTILQSWINETSQYRDERKAFFGRRSMSSSTLKINGDMFDRFRLSGGSLFPKPLENEQDFQNLCTACGLVIKYGQLNNLHETTSETAIFLNPKRMHPSYIQFLRKTYEDPRWASFNYKSSTLRWGMIKYFINPLCKKMKVEGLWFKFKNNEDRLNKRRQMRSFLLEHGKSVPSKDNHVVRYFDAIFENTPLPTESVISHLTELEHNRLAQLEGGEFEEGEILIKTSKANKIHRRHKNNRSDLLEYLELKARREGKDFIPECEICGRDFGTNNEIIRAAYEAAHKIPISIGKRNTNVKDLALLCRVCHGIYTFFEDQAHQRAETVDYEKIGAMVRAIVRVE